MSDEDFFVGKFDYSFAYANNPKGRVSRAISIRPVPLGTDAVCVCGCDDPILNNLRLRGYEGKYEVSLCRRHGTRFTDFLLSLAEIKTQRWLDGWEIACDSCGVGCRREPHKWLTKPPTKGTWAGAFANILCEDCYDMETLFA